MNRRDLLKLGVQQFGVYLLLAQATHASAFAKIIRSKIENWAIDLQTLCLDLRQKEISVQHWQERMDHLYSNVDLPDLLKFIDFESLKKRSALSKPMEFGEKVEFPSIVGYEVPWQVPRALFALKKGEAVVPHAHNDMVSAHFVLSGKYHIKTFDRNFALENQDSSFLYLTPSIDREFGSSELLTMSEDKDNAHWLVATTDNAFTFDVPITKLKLKSKSKIDPAEGSSRIYLDPNSAVKDSGVLRIPILSEKQATEKYSVLPTKNS